MFQKKKNYVFVLYTLFVFLGLVTFFVKLCPLELYDSDDLLYMYTLRYPVPLPGAWNPIKVFPEIFMPIVSYFGALIINPVINNYYFSLTLAHGIFASIILTAYFTQFVMLFYKREFASQKRSIFLGILFILIHFISHIHSGSDNSFLIGAYNVTCFYNYNLCTIVNATLVMHFMTYGGVMSLFKKESKLHCVAVIIWGYFAINSNLYSSVLLAAYVGTELLLILMSELKNHSFNLKQYCQSNWINLIIIVCWFVSNIIETTGGRAGDMSKSFFANIITTLGLTVLAVVSVNIFLLIMEISTLGVWLKKNKGLSSTAKRFLYYEGLALFYIVILSAKVEPQYVLKNEVFISMLFFIILGFMGLYNQLIDRQKRYGFLALILLGTFGLLIINPGNVFHACNYSNLTYANCEALINDVSEQFVAAEKEGKNEIVLELPFYGEDYCWPYTELAKDRFSNVFYKHKLVHSYITVKDIIFSKEKSKEYGISY